MEKWFVINKGADFQAIGQQFHISPVTARLIRNREVVGEDAIRRYLSGGVEDLYDPHLLRDGDVLAEILKNKIEQKKKIRIIGDYDIDGVMSTYILYRGISRCQGVVDYQIPDRRKDGYGINDSMIAAASAEGVDTVLTCDNGISAIEEIAHAKALGMTVLVTDHHEIPFREEAGERVYLRSEADAIVNPHQADCHYPYKQLCGAAVAWKVICLLYEACGIPVSETYEFLENVAFATVGDVMDLTDENRILVKEGLKRIHTTANPGMQALILQSGLTQEAVNAYHFGFVLGPCINASGRLETARKALELFLEQDEVRAAQIAGELVELNLQRKDMTEEGVLAAKEQVEQGEVGEKVMVIFLPEVHESLAGIIAGRIREFYHKPVYVLTRSEDGVKGSGRSIEEYSMYEELCRCRDILARFGGHPMAAGLSMQEEDVPKLRRRLNEYSQLTDEDFIPKIKIDIPMPADYPDCELIREFERLEPFGKGNAKPLFADRDLAVARAAVVGRNRNVLKLTLLTGNGNPVQAVYFGDVEAWQQDMVQRFGEEDVRAAFAGKPNAIRMSVVYVPELNRYQGMESVQLVIRNYR